MTEQEWLACTDALRMLDFLQGKASDRKLRLFAVACCRPNLQCMIESRRRKAADVAERYADGLATEEELQAAHSDLNPIWGESEAFVAWASDSPVRAENICRLQRQKRVNHAALLREVFANPFRPVAVEPAWRTLGVVVIARAIYDESAFVRLPGLADALERAGCQDADILAHCRWPGPHVRGCWAVDALLGKT
jgi:hypothetical protein